MNAENKNSENNILHLDSETSLVLPYFDNSLIANSNIDAINLSLYVLDKIPKTLDQVQITINLVDLNTNIVEDGLSAFINVNKGHYTNFRLPKELFKEAMHTQKRFLIHLVGKNQKILLAGPDITGVAKDPKLLVESTKHIKDNALNRPQIIVNNYYTINNAQLHFGTGDNIGNNKIEKGANQISGDTPLWLKWLVSLVAIFGVGWGVYSYLHTKNNDVEKLHSEQKDDIYDKQKI